MPPGGGRRILSVSIFAVSDVARFVCSSLRCCVCSCLFSTRSRLVARLSETRNRGRRKFTCRDAVLNSGLVSPVTPAEFESAHQADRQLRKDARKRGHTQPLAIRPAKRLKVCSSISASAAQAWETLAQSELPTNRLEWKSVPPAKRLRGKTSLDVVIAQWL